MKTKTLAVIFIVLIGIPAVVAGALSVVLLTKPELIIKPRLAPEEVFAKMIENMQKVKTFHYSMNYAINSVLTAEDITEEDIRRYEETTGKNLVVQENGLINVDMLSMKVDTDVDLSDPDNPKARSALYNDFAGQIIEYQIILVNNSNFIKMKIINSFGDSYASNYEKVENQWIKTDDMNSLEIAYVDNFKKGVGRITALFNDEDFQALEKQELADEKINDKEAYHYRVPLSEYINYLIPNEIMGGSSFGSEDSVDIYIGKKDYLLYKIAFSGNLDDSFFREGSTYSYSMEFSDYGKKLDIKEPDDYKTEKEIFGYSSSEKRNNISIKAELSSARAAAELYAANHGESYKGFCDSENANGISGKISDNGSVFICNDTYKTWAACAQLFKEPANYFCVDHMGNAKEITGQCGNNWEYTTCP